MINSKMLLCIVDYYNKFQVMKKVETLLAINLIQAAKVVFAYFGLPSAGMNFVSEPFKHFCRHLKMDQVVTLPYHQKSNSKVEACIKFVKCTIKKCRKANNNIHFALLQIRSTLKSTGLLSPATMLFSMPIRDYCHRLVESQ